MPAHLYNGLVNRIADEFDRAMSAIEADHNFDLGPEFEVALCKTIRRILPHRFGICRGFVVSADGATAGDDIVIYDRALFPTARFLEDNLAQKEQVPVEAVAAYIEAKHTLQLQGEGDSSLDHALAQAAKVKRLCNARTGVPLNEISRGVNLGTGFSMNSPYGWPSRKNPTYCGLMSRRVRLAKNEPPTANADEIHSVLLTRQPSNDAPPDLVVAGPSNVGVPFVASTSDGGTIESPFMLPQGCGLAMYKADGFAFGVGLCNLLWALDYITLGPIQWSAILQDALGISSAKPPMR
jgi:hypothetical protein